MWTAQPCGLLETRKWLAAAGPGIAQIVYGALGAGSRSTVYDLASRRVLRLFVETALYDLERQEMLPLLAQYPAKPRHVLLVELAVPRWRPLGIYETLTLEEPDLRDRDVGELLLQEGEDVTDREIATNAHSSAAAR